MSCTQCKRFAFLFVTICVVLVEAKWTIVVLVEARPPPRDRPSSQKTQQNHIISSTMLRWFVWTCFCMSTHALLCYRCASNHPELQFSACATRDHTSHSAFPVMCSFASVSELAAPIAIVICRAISSFFSYFMSSMHPMSFFASHLCITFLYRLSS